jgi:hypothetical protein
MVGVGLAAAVAVVGIAWATGALSGDDNDGAPPAVTTTATPVPGVLPEGVYRYQLTKRDVLALDSTLTPKQLGDATGTFTWTIRDGRISLHQTDCQCSLTRVSGAYTAKAKVILVHWPEKAPNGTTFCQGECIDTLGWSFDGEALSLTPVVPDRQAIIFWGARKPWLKVG